MMASSLCIAQRIAPALPSSLCIATGGDERRRRTDATSADDEDPHGEFRFERGVIPLITPLQRTVRHKMLI